MTSPRLPSGATRIHRPWYAVLYIQVLIAIALGVVVGYFFPHLGTAMKPLGDGFIQLIKMMIAPEIFCTVLHDIGSRGRLNKGRQVRPQTPAYFVLRASRPL